MPSHFTLPSCTYLPQIHHIPPCTLIWYWYPINSNSCVTIVLFIVIIVFITCDKTNTVIFHLTPWQQDGDCEVMTFDCWLMLAPWQQDGDCVVMTRIMEQKQSSQKKQVVSSTRSIYSLVMLTLTLSVNQAQGIQLQHCSFYWKSNTFFRRKCNLNPHTQIQYVVYCKSNENEVTRWQV